MAEYRVGIQIGANAQQARSEISAVTTQLSQVGTTLKQAFDTAVFNPFTAALGTAKASLGDLDGKAKQASSTLRLVGSAASTAGGNWKVAGVAATKTAGEIDGFVLSVKTLIKVVQAIIAPVSTLAKYTLGMGNSFSYTTGKIDAVITSTKLAYKAFELLPPRMKAVVLAMGALGIASHSVSGTLHVLSVTAQSTLTHLAHLSAGFVQTALGSLRLGQGIAANDNITEKFSLVVKKISQLMYDLGLYLKFLGGNFTVWGEKLLKASGMLDALNFGFMQFSKTVLGTGSAIKGLSAVMRLLTIQQAYVAEVMNGLNLVIRKSIAEFMALSPAAKAMATAIFIVGTTARIVSGAIALLNGGLNLLKKSFAFLTPVISAVSSALVTFRALAMTALPILAFFAIKGADSMASLSARIGLATQSTDEFNYVQNKLAKIAVQTGAAIDGNVKIFTAANKSIKDMGGNFQSTAVFAELLTKELTISGAATSEINSVLVQTSQMLAKGLVSGDEYASLRENGPLIVEAMSQALHLTKAELSDLSEKQRLTSDMLVYSLLKQKQTIDEAYGKLPVTVGRAWGQLWNTAQLYAGQLKDLTGEVAKSISDFAKGAAESLQSGQFAQELKAISIEFSLLKKDIDSLKSLNIIDSDAAFHSFDNFFVRLRTVVRNFVINALAEFDLVKAKIATAFTAGRLDDSQAGRHEYERRAAEIEKIRTEMIAASEKEAADAIQKKNDERQKGVDLLKQYQDQQAQNTQDEKAKVDETIAALEPKIKAKLAGGVSEGLSEGIEKLETALTKAAKQFGFDLGAVQTKFAETATKYGIDPNLLKAVAYTESNFNPNAKSSAGAVGMAQFMPDTAKRFGVTDRTDPFQSIEGMGKYFAFLKDTFKGDIKLMLAGYNAGENAVIRHNNQVPPYPETKNYVKEILGNYDESLSAQYESGQKLLASQQQAKTTLAESKIDQTLKKAEFESSQAIDALNKLKSDGKISITQYWLALTQQQQVAAQASIDAVKAKLVENARQKTEAMANAAPEELPTIEANFKVKQDDLNQQLAELETKLKAIPSANLIDARKEQRELNSVIAQAKAKIAELNGELVNNPVAIKARLEIENADLIGKLRAGGQGDLASQYLNALTATEQAGVYESQISKLQSASQTKAQSINIAQEGGLISSFQAQQQLRELYAQTSDEIDNLASSLSELGANSGLDTLKIKALDAKNAAAQLRLTIPSIGQQFVTTGQEAAISGLSDGLYNMAKGAQSAGTAFRQMGLTVVDALQKIAAQKLAESLIGMVFKLGTSALSGMFGSTEIGTPNSGGLGDTFANQGLDFYSVGKAEGGLITGAGTGTSDSISRRMRVGSYILKASAVKALGTPFLDSLRALSTSTSQIRSTIPTLVSHGEYEIPPDLVSRLGVPYFEQLNRVADAPARFASGGVVGGKSAVATVGDNITVNVNTTVNESNDSTVSKSGKFDHVNAFSEQMKSLVKNEIVQQLRNGGELAKALRN